MWHSVVSQTRTNVSYYIFNQETKKKNFVAWLVYSEKFLPIDVVFRSLPKRGQHARIEVLIATYIFYSVPHLP